jgi:hypothetical protein
MDWATFGATFEQTNLVILGGSSDLWSCPEFVTDSITASTFLKNYKVA